MRAIVSLIGAVAVVLGSATVYVLQPEPLPLVQGPTSRPATPMPSVSLHSGSGSPITPSVVLDPTPTPSGLPDASQSPQATPTPVVITVPLPIPTIIIVPATPTPSPDPLCRLICPLLCFQIPPPKC